MNNTLGIPIAPRIGFAPTRTHKRTIGLHLPSSREIKRAADKWQRSQSLRAGSAYYETPPMSPKNLNRKSP